MTHIVRCYKTSLYRNTSISSFYFSDCESPATWKLFLQTSFYLSFNFLHLYFQKFRKLLAEDEPVIPLKPIKRKPFKRFSNWFKMFLENESCEGRWVKYFRMTKPSFMKLVDNIEPLVFPFPQTSSGKPRVDIRYLFGCHTNEVG